MGRGCRWRRNRGPFWRARGSQWCGYAMAFLAAPAAQKDRKSTRLNSSHRWISYAVFCLKKNQSRVFQETGFREGASFATVLMLEVDPSSARCSIGAAHHFFFKGQGAPEDNTPSLPEHLSK